MRVHLVQLDSVWESPQTNAKRVGELLANASVRPGDLAVLPEMFDTGFSFNLERTADMQGQTLGLLRQLATERRITLQGARTVLGHDGRGRNCATVIDPAGELLCEYQKVHPFSFGRESERFSGGDRVKTYRWSAGDATNAQTSVCPTICYDLRFPELYRAGMFLGAEVFALGANWPAPRKLHRQALAVARAIENLAYVVCVNRAGSDPFLSYAGGSMVVDPKGEVLAAAGEDECVLTVDLDVMALRAWRGSFPALRDVRLIDPGTFAPWSDR